jgi:uncharacterized membrane protein YfcA
MTLFLLACLAAFFAGFIDSIAGGGGLIQVPVLLFLFPNMPIVTLLGTNKLAASSGTVISSYNYVKALEINLKKFLPALLAAFVFSMIGAKILSLLNDELLKPLIFFLLLAIGIYTLFKKELGQISQLRFTGYRLQFLLILIGAVLGFYDGFFGPGMGSLLIFCYVSLIGFSFLEGSAFAKLTNLSANIAACGFFIFHHHVVYRIGIPMAFFNIVGNYVGSKLAIQKGSAFVRGIFLIVISGILLQMGFHLLRF